MTLASLVAALLDLDMRATRVSDGDVRMLRSLQVESRQGGGLTREVSLRLELGRGSQITVGDVLAALSVSGVADARTVRTSPTPSGDFIELVATAVVATGSRLATVTGAKTFTLDGSVGSGAYTSGGRVGTATRISRCVYAGQNGYWAGNGQWRGTPAGNADGTIFTIINQTAWKAAAAEQRLLAISTYPWRGTRYAITEPWVMAPNSPGGSQFIQFQPYNAALITGTPQVSVDTTATFDSRNWYIYGSNSTTALAVAYS
jgi:hypothetical protein